jgi:hypothetical protein
MRNLPSAIRHRAVGFRCADDNVIGRGSCVSLSDTSGTTGAQSAQMKIDKECRRQSEKGGMMDGLIWKGNASGWLAHRRTGITWALGRMRQGVLPRISQRNKGLRVESR